METSTSTTRFKFRDHRDADASAVSDVSSDLSSLSADPLDVGDGEDDSDLQSMTAKGIKHLCSELIELKAASDEEFQNNIFANYSEFLKIFEEVEGIENELLKLKVHVSNQKKMVKELVDGVYVKMMADEVTVEVAEDDSVSDESVSFNELDAHIHYVSETLDNLLSENRIDEALVMLEMENGNIERLQQRKGSLADALKLYNSVISQGKAMLVVKLKAVAENQRTPAAELQRALSRLCRVGDGRLAMDLLLKYYHARIEAGVRSLQISKLFPSGVYLRELSKFVFSMISQAARSSVMLYGETSPYASELSQWAEKETEAFASCFCTYIRSISEISGGLSVMIQSLQLAISFSSQLEAQNLVLKQYLIKQIHLCIEKALETHTHHFKKVVAIFTASDSWALGKYLVCGILVERCASVFVGDRPEYCLLTGSGRKLVTLLQAIAHDVSPLAALGMESPAIKCLTDLFMEYILAVEKIISGETCHAEMEDDDHAADSMDILMKNIFMLMNLSTLECLFSRVIRDILSFQGQIESSNADELSMLGDSFSSIQVSLGQVRSLFLRQYISRVASDQTYDRVLSKASSSDPSGFLASHDAEPSIPLQVFFLELRKIGKLAEEVVEVSWMLELFRDMVTTMFCWVSGKELISTHHGESMAIKYSECTQEKLITDIQFLVEISKHGRYFWEKPIELEKLKEAAFQSVGLDHTREPSADESAVIDEVIQKVLRIEEEEESDFESEQEGNNQEETEPCNLQSIEDARDSIGSEECPDDMGMPTGASTGNALHVPGSEADSAGDQEICSGEVRLQPEVDESSGMS